MASLVILGKDGTVDVKVSGSLSPTGAKLDVSNGETLSWREHFGPVPKKIRRVLLLRYGAAEAFVNPEGISRIAVQIESPNWKDMHQLILCVTAYAGGHIRYLGGQGPSDFSFVRGVGNDVRHLYEKTLTLLTSLRKKIGFRIAT